MPESASLNVTLLTATLSNAAGGLSASVPRLAANLAKMSDIKVDIVGVTDPADMEAFTNWGANVHANREFGPAAFHYAPGVQDTLNKLSPDVIDVQGLWTYPSLANLLYCRRTGTPYLITPRGMLDPWAVGHSSWKKKLVRWCFEDSHLKHAACLRATAEMEARHFREFGLRNPIAIVPNGVDIPGPAPRHTQSRRRLLFLSRLHPKKGLPFLLRAWQRLAPQRPDWELVIAGPDEIGHKAELMRLAGELKLESIFWQDPVYGDEKSALYRSADIFVLPTHGENFGLVVAEALAHEIPVITTIHAPWSEMSRHECGWWIDLSDEPLFATLKEATAMPRSVLDDMGARGRAWMQRDYDWAQVAQKMASVYRWIAGKGSRPDFVLCD